ncbi:hypothetical protein T484DRAFT_3638764, partial [Baffinella frigidus]
RKPSTLHPAPCTLHPAPCTLHPAPCTMHHAPCTLHHAPCTLKARKTDRDLALRVKLPVVPPTTTPTLIPPPPSETLHPPPSTLHPIRSRVYCRIYLATWDYAAQKPVGIQPVVINDFWYKKVETVLLFNDSNT